MTKRPDRPKDSPARKNERLAAAAPAPGGPEGIPGRSPNPAAWKYVLLAAIVLAWLAFLVYCQQAGNR